MEKVRQNENLSNLDADEGEKNQHDALDENNVSNGNPTETPLSQSSTRTSFFPVPIFSQIRDGVHSAFSGKSFHLPHWWDSGASRFVKIKKDGVTYAVLLGKTLDDMPYCFRVRRDENEKKAFFTPMAIYASTSSTSTTSTSTSCAMEVQLPECDIKLMELETLPDIVTYERGKFRAAVQQIFEAAGESHTAERLEELVKDHAEEGMEFLIAFRALHPPLHLLPIKEETSAVLHCGDEAEEVVVEDQKSEKTVNENSEEDAFSEGVEPSNDDKMSLTKEEEEEENEEEEEKNVNGYRSVQETSHSIITLGKENDLIKNENERLHEEMESLMTEKNEFLICIENLRTEVMGLTERMDCIEKLCMDEMDSLRDKTEIVECTEVTEIIRSSTPITVEECVKVVFSLYSQKVTQLQEQQDNLQNEVNQIRSDTLRVSHEHSEKLLSVLELRERQLSTALKELERKDSNFCSNCQEKLGNTKQNGNLNTKSLPRGVSGVEKDDDNDDDELRVWISTHNRQNTKRSAIERSIKKDNEMEGTEENNFISQTSPMENKTFSVLRMGYSGKKKKYNHTSDIEPQHLLTYLHSCSNTFKHSPWRRAPYTALGYTNETLYHQHTPDRGVGLTTMPPKTWSWTKRRQFNKNNNRQTHVPAQRSSNQSTQLPQEEKDELEMLAQPPDD